VATYLLDTNVVSELGRVNPDPRVMGWATQCPEADQHLSAITIGELVRGAARLPMGKRRSDLIDWVQRDLAGRFIGRILAFDDEVAAFWGFLRAQAERRGKTAAVLDSQIAATAIFRGATLVTRDVRDFEGLGVRLINPWDEV
jgi:toxin FitB